MKSTRQQEIDQERLATADIFKAKQVVNITENPVHVEYMAKAQASLFNRFIECAYKDTDTMQQIHAELSAQRRHEINYEKVVSSGKLAETILERLASKIKQMRY